MLESYDDFLTPEECLNVTNKVHELKEHWKNRGGYFEYPFFSLGAASYMDAVEDANYYYQEASRTNGLLNMHFSWLYERVAIFLKEKLGKPAFYHPRFALPGFHIFLDDDLFEIPIASRHVDLQYKLLDWGELKFHEEDCISFTVYTKMPSSGGGLNLWNYTFQDLGHLPDRERQDKLAAEEYSFKEFKTGQLVLHDGLHFHQIAEMKNVQPGDQRVSLQGHGVLSEGNYFLYW